MPMYRKKPVVIEARNHTAMPEDIAAIIDWIRDNGGTATWRHDYDASIVIQTLEGVMKAEPGDWVIRGVAGEFYPCKPDIFEATYELESA